MLTNLFQDSGTSTSYATERFNERRRHAHPLNARPSFPSPSLLHPHDPEDDDDFSLEGFGDISLSNAYFIPGKTTGLTPIKRSKPAPSESPRPSLRNNTLAKTSIYDFDNDAGGDGHASDFESSTDTRVALEKLVSSHHSWLRGECFILTRVAEFSMFCDYS